MAVAMSKAPAASGKRMQMLIDGSWVDCRIGRARSPSRAPGNRQIIASIPRGNAEDVDRAVQAARKAFPSWSQVSRASAAACC